MRYKRPRSIIKERGMLIEEVDLDKEQAPMEIASRYGLPGLSSTRFNKASSLKKICSFVGDFDSDGYVR